jgi:hypothetical protein
VTAAFAVFVLTGGLDVYTKSYESLTSWTFLPQGQTAAVLFTVATLVVWTAFASVVQVLVYRRALAQWPGSPIHEDERRPEPAEPVAGRFDPRAVALAAAIAFTLLVAGISWPVLAAVAMWLAVAALVGGGDRSVAPTGMLLALLLGGGVLLFTLLGGLGADEAFRRAVRALLLVLVATWLRAAAGAGGLREVSRRGLGKLGPIPPAREASAVMDELGSGRQLGPAARSVLGSLRAVQPRPMPVVDAVLGWVVEESRRFRPTMPSPALDLRARLRDALLVAGVTACGAALFV